VQSLKDVAKDEREAVRNSSVRTLFLAISSHADKFPPDTLRECMQVGMSGRVEHPKHVLLVWHAC
jgi:hypothetical protein